MNCGELFVLGRIVLDINNVFNEIKLIVIVLFVYEENKEVNLIIMKIFLYRYSL